jgi:hypothetical protein
MSAPKLDLHAIDRPIIKSAIEAMNGRNKKQWYELFSDKPELTDDGNPHDFIEWSERGAFWFFGGLSGLKSTGAASAAKSWSGISASALEDAII